MSGSTPPDFVAARDRVVSELVRFARSLRRQGVDVPANAAVGAAEALAVVGLDDRERVADALRAALLSTPEDRAVFEAAFPEFWYGLRTGLEAEATADAGDGFPGGEDAASDSGDRRRGLTVAPGEAREDESVEGGVSGDEAGTSSRVRDPMEDPVVDGDRSERDDRSGTASVAGRARTVETSPGGIDDGLDRRDLERFVDALAGLEGRRWRRASTGAGVDFRRTFRRAVTAGGVPVPPAPRDRNPEALRACVLVDVSESVLDAVDRGFLLDFLAGIVDRGRDVRVFFFDTSIREVTGAFEERGESPADVLAAAEVEWGGGTQIGESIRRFRRRWPDAVDRRTATIVVGDGLEAGAVDTLEREIAWLSRRSGSLVWLNPLAVSAAYSPVCRGMAAALPYVDGLFAFGRSADLAEAARQLDRHGPRGPIGFQHDYRERDPSALAEVDGR